MPEQQEWTYADRPLPIGCGQTISQPFIVALMTELLAPGPEDVVLEVGTGSGYQAAILAHLVRQVYSLERIPELADVASRRLQDLGFTNVEVRTSDGSQGWEEQAPFDGIIVTAAAADVPPVLVRQLKPGGRLVIPVGPPHRTQDLRVLDKDSQGMVRSRSVLPVVFVPLV
ncbi:MAG: protein-L-isoaspartate(D-aspartate) O-methyltransferase [Candidatus Competibacteraceae bacterium]